MKRLRITSDGINNTRILDAETGADLTQSFGIRRVTWSHDAGDLAMATLDLELIEMNGEACGEWWMRNPSTGKPGRVARVCFADGTDIELV